MTVYTKLFLGVLAFAAVHACVPAEPATQGTDGPRPLGRFAMHVNDGKASIEMLADDVATSRQGLHVPATAFSNDGDPLTGDPETFEAQTLSAVEPGGAGCGATENCFQVRINSRMTRPIRQFLMRIDSTSPGTGHEPVNDEALPIGAGIPAGLSGVADGVYNFGSIAALGQSGTEDIRLSATAGSRYTVFGSFWEGVDCADATATPPAHVTPITGNVRGYIFTAPQDMRITGVRVPQVPGQNRPFQNFAILRFDNQTPPPVFSMTTNAFTHVALGLGQPSNVFIATDAVVAAGDIVGVYGTTSNFADGSGAVNSYANNGGGMTLFGSNVALTRSGMQFVLGTATTPTGMRNVWREASASISRVEFTYEAISCNN